MQDNCSRCCGVHRETYNELKKTLPVIPLVNSSLQAESNSSIQDVSDIKELQNRLNALEIFLKEYVVDINYLEKMNRIDE